MPRIAIPRAEKGRHTKAHAHAPKQERRIAYKLGGSVTPGSGCGRVKGDVRVKGIARIECKGTLAKSFSVTREMVAKIELAGLPNGAEIPAIQIDFLKPDGSIESSVAVLPLYILELLTNDPR